MNKVKLLTLLVVGLLIANLSLIGFLVFEKSNHSKHKGPRDSIIERLHFNKTQIAEYDTLIKWHRHEIRTTEHKIMDTKSELYASLGQTTNSFKNDSLIAMLGQMQVKIETINYKHFADIKKLCHPNQRPAFNKLSEELAFLFSKQPPGKKGR